MNARKHEAKIVAATFVLILYVLSLSVVSLVISSVQTSKNVSNVGSIKAVGLGVYWDQSCSNKTSSINWGVVEPGSNKTATVYIRNEGNSAATLTKTTSNWIPSNASNYLTLTWNYAGQTVNVNQVVQVKFTLAVSSSVSGITSFSFDLTITASG